MSKYLESYDRNRQRVGILIEAYEVSRLRRINSDDEITFYVPMTSDDFKEKLILKGFVKDERGQYYVINSRQRVRDGRKLTAQIVCKHMMFSLIDYKFPYASYVKEGYGIQISQLTDKITAATRGRFSFVIHDTFDLHDIKDFGRGNCLEALNDLVNIYGAEIEPDNFTIHIRKKIGTDASLQYRIQKNIISASFTDNVSSLCTRLYAQMKDGRTWIGQPASILTADERTRLLAIPGAIVNGVLQSNYLVSQYAGAWSSDGTQFYDSEIIEQNITDVDELLRQTRKNLAKNEMPSFEVTVNAADMYKIDEEETKPELGDTVYLVDPELGLSNITARITEITEYPFDIDKHTQATIANVMRKDYAEIMAELDKTRKTVDGILSGGLIRTELFESFAKQAVIDINASKTEVKYDSRGIILQSLVNAQDQVIMTSNGIILTTDGGVTARTAITARGINAELVSGQLGAFVSLLIGTGNNVTQINTNGIAAGNSSFSSAPFQVKMNGDVIARSITLTGKIENSAMSSSNITGGTITGALLRTSASGARVEVDASGWRTYDANNRTRIVINANDSYGMSAIQWNKTTGALSGSINGNDRLFQILSQGSMQLVSNGGSIFFQGSVDFTNASLSGIGISAVSGLQTQLSSLASKPSASQTATNMTYDSSTGNLKMWNVNGDLLSMVNLK